MISKFHIVIRCRSSRASQLIRNIMKVLNDCSSYFSRIGFQNTAFIKYNSDKFFCNKSVKFLVVCYIDSINAVLLTINNLCGISKFLRFSFCLICNCKWRKNQNLSTSVFMNLIRPRQLHRRLSKSTICKYTRLSLL